jgi:hypothetical protein
MIPYPPGDGKKALKRKVAIAALNRRRETLPLKFPYFEGWAEESAKIEMRIIRLSKGEDPDKILMEILSEQL